MSWQLPVLKAFGQTLVHPNETQDERFVECRTSWPTSVCTCGHFRIQWAMTVEEVARILAPGVRAQDDEAYG